MYTFIHIPKTGGNSICSENNIEHTITHEVSIGLINITELGINKSKIYNPMTVVRNPYSRFTSAYNFLKGGGVKFGIDLHYCEILNSMSIDDFILNLHTYMFEIIHFVPQHYFTSTDLSKITLFKFEDVVSDLCEIKFNQHLNKTELIVITELTEQQKEVIYNLYKLDFDLFGY